MNSASQNGKSIINSLCEVKIANFAQHQLEYQQVMEIICKRSRQNLHTHTHQIQGIFYGAAVLYMLLDKNVNTYLKSSSFLVCIQLKDWNSL